MRLPRRELAAPLVDHELRWLPGLAARLPLPIAAPVRAGEPGEGYPWRWAVVPWFDGATAADEPPADLAEAADALGAFVRALHGPAPADAPRSRWRGITLRERAVWFDEHLATVGAWPEPARLADGRAVAPLARAAWDELAATRPWEGPPWWLHGDLHPGNLIVRDGRLAAIIDFGDLCGGDPAGDLSSAWMLLPVEHHARFRAAAGTHALDDATWARGRAWALSVAVAILATSGPPSPTATPGPMARVAATTLPRVLHP